MLMQLNGLLLRMPGIHESVPSLQSFLFLFVSSMVRAVLFFALLRIFDYPHVHFFRGSGGPRKIFLYPLIGPKEVLFPSSVRSLCS